MSVKPIEAGDSLPGVPIINCAAYVDGRRVADLDLDHIQAALATPDQFVWLGLYEPDQRVMRLVQEQFGLHDLAIEDAIHAHQRPKLEVYEDSLFVVLRTAQLVGESRHLETAETHIFVGRNYIVTVRHGSLQSHVGVRQRCETTPHALARGPGYVLYALMDFVVDQFVPIVVAIEEDVQAIEDAMIDDPTTGNPTIRIYRLKRDLLTLRRQVSPLVEVCNRLMRFDLPNIPDEARPYFRDVYDHIVRVNETIDMQRELLTTALEAHLSLISVTQNEQMKRVTAWAAMIAVPTMIAGVYGMNFANMPELQWAYGYYGSLAVMAAACGVLYFAFKRSGWL